MIWHSRGLNLGLRGTKFFKKKLCDSTKFMLQHFRRKMDMVKQNHRKSECLLYS
jgi:hypothetical protein